MAVEILSPWPPSSAIAISVLKDAISPGASSIEIERLGMACSLRVEKHAPLAPAAIRTEALILLAGYLLEAGKNGAGALRGEQYEVDGLKIEKQMASNHAAAFKNCGAAGILSPWKVRRAGAI